MVAIILFFTISLSFGEAYEKDGISSFFNDDKDGVLQKSRMTQNGKLTERYAYLPNPVDGERMIFLKNRNPNKTILFYKVVIRPCNFT